MAKQKSPFWLGYDAVEQRGRRRQQPARIKHEDTVLTGANRTRLQATAQDVQRNFAIASWAVRKHLDYVSSFSFASRTGDDEVDQQVEDYINAWSQRSNCDVRRQHPFRRMIRMAEARRVVDGDFFFLKLTGDGVSRGKLQAIESDRIATPGDLPRAFDTESFRNGVKTTTGGTPQSYCICRRDEQTGQLTFERVVPASSLFVHGFYERFDQVRGISPLASALNTLQDVYEGFDYALAKMKVSQLFGLVFYRDAEAALQGTIATLDSDNDGVADSGYEVDFGKGPVQLDLNPGDRAEFLEAKTPASETVAFLQMMIHVALKSLDIPYSFFDESFTNFYGSRAGLQQYQKSCETKIADLQEVLDEITAWRLGLAILDGDLALPRGIEFEQLKWEWVPRGVAWWDPQKEVKGNTMAIAAGLDNPQRICRDIGTDFYENIDAIADAMAYAKMKGVPLNLATTGTTNLQDLADDSEEDTAEEEAGENEGESEENG